jgi:hypothetical protein
MDLNGFLKNASKCKEMFILTKWVASTWNIGFLRFQINASLENTNLLSTIPYQVLTSCQTKLRNIYFEKSNFLFVL